MAHIELLRVKYSDGEVAHFDSEDQFMEASVDLLNQTVALLWNIVELKYCDSDAKPIVIDKENAVMAGNLVRLIKLNISLLQNICERKLEICQIINRCIAETVVNIKYLLVEREERVRRNYIKYSLITEKELWETIISNVKQRNGDTLPIEERMQDSIQKSFDDSDMDLDDVNRSSKWKSVKARADVVADEMFYSVYYGTASHAIHGNWQDILFNNLQKIETGFKVKLDWELPRPQIIDGPSILNLETIELFVEKELKENSKSSILTDNCKVLLNYQAILTDYHEKWLSRK